MKRTTYFTLALMLVSTVSVSAQGWNGFKNKVKEEAEKISIPKELPSSDVLSQDEVGRGLKEALNQGVKKGVEQLNKKGVKCSKNRVAHRMTKLKIRAVAKKKFKVTTDSEHTKPIFMKVGYIWRLL